MVQAAGDREHSKYLPAINRFIAAYWKPVFYFLRVKGYPYHQAQDLTQEFFSRFLERDWLKKADPERGRFRNFLLAILKRFLSDQGPHRAPRQKQFEQGVVSIEKLISDEERSYEPATSETPEEVFMKRWAAALVQNVLEQLRQLCENEGHPVWYDVFIATHYPAASTQQVTQQALATRLGLTRDKVRYALEEAKKRFNQLLRGEIQGQVGSKATIG